MSCLLSTRVVSGLSKLAEQLDKLDCDGESIRVWVFADHTSRTKAQKALRELGFDIEILSAYKPLLHYFLESVDLSNQTFERVEIFYPQNQHAAPTRFLLEAYPLAALIDSKSVLFTADPNLASHYRIRVYRAQQDVQEIVVLAPNIVCQSATGELVFRPTGWIQVLDKQGRLSKELRLESDFEQVFELLMTSIQAYDWPSHSPYFERLVIDVKVPYQDDAIGYEHEVVSLKEALHEDLYFSIQEWFKYQEGKVLSARDSQPGQIVPLIHDSHDGQYHLELRLEPYTLHEPSTTSLEFATLALDDLDTISQPISIEQLERQFDDLPGQRFSAETVTGFRVNAKYIQGDDTAVYISGGQHANETSGVVGALRAAKQLLQKSNAHLVISPLENPDGYLLNHEFMQLNSQHMNHAARYTALGDDLEYRQCAPFYEQTIRHQAAQFSKAKLHINLHGYPSHEWTRPLSGYVPQGFEMWTIPKGFFLIVRYQDDDFWAEYAEQFIQQLTAQLALNQQIVEFNRRQIALYQQHAGDTGFRIVNQFPCFVSKVEECDIPLQLITEFPDETLYGEAFVFAHEIQQQTVVTAYQVHQRLWQ